jgi:transcriptional repressor NrdR
VICHTCSAPTKVVETRSVDEGAATRRRRVCTACGHRMTTYERVEADRLWVRKRNGARQRFDPMKLRAAVTRATHKRAVEATDLDELVSRVQSSIERAGGEVSSRQVSDTCLAALRDLDRGAYLQFLGTVPEKAEFAGAAR